jgi:hypothetical protein
VIHTDTMDIQPFQIFDEEDEQQQQHPPKKKKAKAFGECPAITRTRESATASAPPARMSSSSKPAQYVFPAEPQCLVRDTVEVLNRLREMRGRVQDPGTLPCAPIMPAIMATLPENQPEPTGVIQVHEYSPETAHKVGSCCVWLLCSLILS